MVPARSLEVHENTVLDGQVFYQWQNWAFNFRLLSQPCFSLPTFALKGPLCRVAPSPKLPRALRSGGGNLGAWLPAASSELPSLHVHHLLPRAPCLGPVAPPQPCFLSPDQRLTSSGSWSGCIGLPACQSLSIAGSYSAPADEPINNPAPN